VDTSNRHDPTGQKEEGEKMKNKKNEIDVFHFRRQLVSVRRTLRGRLRAHTKTPIPV
jgi:hypothetical protein